MSLRRKTRENRVKKLSDSDLSAPLVVATVHSPAGLRLAERLGPGDVDLLEIRVDALAENLSGVRRLAAKAKLPLLLTVRHPAEGGIGKLSAATRKNLLVEFLPSAAVVDVELRSAAAMREVIAAAKARGIRVVISDHHFRRTPTLAQMRERRRRAFAAGADVFKLACLAGKASAVARLLDFVSDGKIGTVAAMGMGKFGQVSRIALACAGSTLNYGYLDAPNAPGQWEARELKSLLRRMGK
jgi:3-dehydroquinate dehydratase-1